MNKKVLIIGFGSIGKRHLKICRQMGYENIVVCVHDEKKVKYIRDKYDVICTHVLDIAINHAPHFAIVCNPTSFHIEVANVLIDRKIPFLMEKPISNNLKALKIFQNRIKESKLPIMFGFQLRHHPHFLEMKRILDSGVIGNPIILQGFVGQYLPEWRQDVDYSTTTSANDFLGGGVILDLSHEVDIAIQLMGKPSSVFSYGGKFSDLDIDTEDAAVISLRHDLGISTICLNYLERKYKWVTNITCSKGSISWDYGRDNLRIIDKEGVTQVLSHSSDMNRDDLFSKQLLRFIDYIEKGKISNSDIQLSFVSSEVCLLAKDSIKSQKQFYFN